MARIQDSLFSVEKKIRSNENGCEKSILFFKLYEFVGKECLKFYLKCKANMIQF